MLCFHAVKLSLGSTRGRGFIYFLNNIAKPSYSSRKHKNLENPVKNRSILAVRALLKMKAMTIGQTKPNITLQWKTIYCSIFPSGERLSDRNTRAMAAGCTVAHYLPNFEYQQLFCLTLQKMKYII